MARITISPPKIRKISLGLGILSTLPFSWGVLTGFYLWISPLVLLNSVISQRGLTLLNLLGVSVLAAAFFKDRFFCLYLCPTGVICDWVARRRQRPLIRKSVPRINKPLALASLFLSFFGIPLIAALDPVNAFYNFFNVFHSDTLAVVLVSMSGLLTIILLSTIAPGSWCSRICPLGGLQLLLTDVNELVRRKLENERKLPVRQGRRQVLTGAVFLGLGLIFSFTARRTLGKSVFRPPGSLTGEKLKEVCIRCGNCMKACPTEIIQPSMDPLNPTGIMTPELDFTHSYCLPECTRCGNVCPSGAIIRFDQEEKKRLVIGSATIDLGKCLWSYNQDCNQCILSCGYNAICMDQSKDTFATYPRVNQSCVGCGACKIVCPADAIKIETLSRYL